MYARNIHELYTDNYFDRLDELRLRLGYEPSPQQRDRLSDKVWAEVNRDPAKLSATTE